MPPPSSRQRRSASRTTIVDQLRAAVESSGLSDYELARRAGRNRSVINRFMTGQRGLTLDTACALCEVLGLRLADAGGRRPARRNAGAAAEATAPARTTPRYPGRSRASEVYDPAPGRRFIEDDLRRVLQIDGPPAPRGGEADGPVGAEPN